MRIAGFNIPDAKRVDIGLTYLYGIGRSNVVEILNKASVDSSKRVSALSEDEQKRIQKILEGYKIEGDLRAEVLSNARTKRGKRVTIGAIKKEAAVKMGIIEKEKKE